MVNSSAEEVAPVPQEDSVVVGRIVGAWGLNGELKVQSQTDNPGRLSVGSQVYLAGRPTVIERSNSVKAGLRLKLDLAGNRTEAEELRGLLLTVPRDQIAPLPDGSYYHFQIVGIEVFSEEGEPLGKVSEILNTGSNDVYVVKFPDRKHLLLPAIADVILKVDLAENKMTVQVPEGLR